MENSAFLNLAAKRYSVRAYQNKPVEEEKISKILEAGKLAPTAVNLQPYKIYAAVSTEAREKLKKVCICTFDAPVIFVIGYDKNLVWHNSRRPELDTGMIDASIVLTHMMLEATDLGLGSCWVCRFDPDEVSKALGLPENIVITSLLPVGYAAEDAKPSDRHLKYRDQNEIVEII